MFYLSESITFEGQVPIWRVSGTAKMSKSALGGVQKNDAGKTMKIIKKYEKVQKADLHEVWHIPHGFDVFMFCNLKLYIKMRGNK